MQGIYNYISDVINVSRVHIFAAILQLQFMSNVMLLHTSHLFVFIMIMIIPKYFKSPYKNTSHAIRSQNSVPISMDSLNLILQSQILLFISTSSLLWFISSVRLMPFISL